MGRNIADKRQRQLWKQGVKGIQVWEWKEQAEKEGGEGKEPNRPRLEKALVQAFYWKGLDGEARHLFFSSVCSSHYRCGYIPHDFRAAPSFLIFSRSSEPWLLSSHFPPPYAREALWLACLEATFLCSLQPTYVALGP